MTITRFPHGLSSFGVPIFGSDRDISGNTWFVDGNMGSNSNDGSEWDQAFGTLAYAFAVSHADIARTDQAHYARRNTIYICGDTFSETLVAFPQKTDVIGCGSYDANSMAGITGNHAPVNTNYGCRFFNVWFKAPAVAAPIITLTSASSGNQFIGCMFDGVVGTVTTGITATAATVLKIIDCKFIGGFATADVSIATGAMLSVEIRRNIMIGSAGNGVLINSGTTVAYGGVIAENFISSTTICINDASGKFNVYNNRCITANAQGTAGAGAIVAGAKMMQDNRISASDVANAVVPAQGALA